VRTTLPGSLAHHRILRGLGIGTWIFLGLPILDASTRRGYTLTDSQWLSWLVCFWLFGAAFWYSSAPNARAPWTRLAALSIEATAALGMTFILQDYFVGFLLAIVSWQAALLLPLTIAGAWMAVTSAALILFLEPHYYMGWRWGATGAFAGFQVFAIVTAAVAQRESASREEQARINAELVSTRELLRESSKLHERMRISRELHDSVGHHLTALSLHLEAALNGPPGDAREGIRLARDAATQALDDVRAVVSATHGGDEIPLIAALRSLEERLPRIRLHLSVSDDLRLTDAARANAVLRCVQELATNTLKHSDAANLWIAVRTNGGAIDIDARDDGRRAAHAESGFGLTTMRQRFEELGGGVAIDDGQRDGEGRGFLVRAWLPSHDRVK